MSREALKMALEALERGETELRWKAITAIQEALAQEQWTPKDMAYRPGGLSQPEEQQSCGKREWVGLTDSEVDNIVAYPWGETKNWIKAVEDALKEKNA